ncbi:CopG family DNA-binding protein [Mycobacterium tuberculosis]|nr:CopG family DNA-binding protein [Mycobacterium tuberculosis]SGK10614.1 CopG family DNA-binding protein [Mycobacterium tuberculosis]SGK96984.1 CopG family DNA-binding protein [Mycobacterium tuberculosis]SGZ82869.1 CopG family DNA-binding protein [Mycobacterium tuberculosis]
MTKEKISVTVDAAVLAAIDADARAAGLNRSEMIEQALRNEHLRCATSTCVSLCAITRLKPYRRWTSMPTHSGCTRRTGRPEVDRSRRHRAAPRQ